MHVKMEILKLLEYYWKTHVLTLVCYVRTLLHRLCKKGREKPVSPLQPSPVDRNTFWLVVHMEGSPTLPGLRLLFHPLRAL